MMDIKKYYTDLAKEELELAYALYGADWTKFSPPCMHEAMLISEHFECLYCGLSFIEKEEVIKCHIEHMDPLSLGGRDDITNVVMSCVKCNLSKGAMRFDEWLECLSEPFKSQSRKNYIEKHKYNPEDFNGEKDFVISLGDFFDSI